MVVCDLHLGFYRDNPLYVYIYRDPRPGKNKHPIYVGKGKAANGRADVHWKHGSQNRILESILRKIRNIGMEPIIEIVGWFNDDESAFKYERELIAKYGRRCLGEGTLANITLGGEGASGMKHSPESIEKTRKAHLGSRRSLETRKRLSDAWTPERRAAHSLAQNGKLISESQRQKQSSAMKGRKRDRAIVERSAEKIRNRKQTEEHKRNSGNGIKKAWTPERRKDQAERFRNWRKAQPLKSHCVHGHEFIGDNVYIKPGSGVRECRACNRERSARDRAKKNSTGV